jgi:hypothetical protein
VSDDSKKTPEIFTHQQIAAVLILTIGGGLIRALQPLLLGALVHEGHLTIAQLGWAATLEFLAIGITIGAAGTWLKLERLRTISTITIISFVLFNIGTVFASPYMFLLLRALNGVSSGIILWMLFGMVARTRVPARVMGLYIGSQAGVALVLASFCSWYIIPTFGGSGGFLVLSVACAALIFCVPFVPSRFGPLVVEQSERRWPGIRGFTALIAVFAYATGIMSLWVYVDPLARQGGLGEGVIGYAISAGLAMQVLGGWVASFFGRLTPVVAIAVGGCVNIVVLGFLLVGAPPLIFIAAVAIFGFLWAFILSFVTPFVMKSDPTGRAVMLIGTAELFGAATGPALVSLFVDAVGPQAAPLVSATLFAAGGLICLALQIRPARIPLAVS